MTHDDFDIDKAREIRERAKGGFFKESRKSLMGTLLFSLPFSALITFAGANWAQPTEPELRVFYGLVFLLGLLMSTVVWAVYGLDARLLFLLKEIKQLRLDFLSSAEAPPESATGGAESLSVWAVGALKPKALIIVVTVFSTLAALGGVLAYELSHKYSKAFGGQEIVEVHVTPEGMFRVCSRISITKCAANVAAIPFRIPQPGATLESVAVAGRRIPFTPVPDKKDTYTVMPGLPEEALKNAVLEVVWTPQMEDIRIRGDCRYFSLRLQGIIPFTSFTANAVIDDGAPYQFAYPDTATVKSLNLFWSRRPYKGYYGNAMGSCEIAIQAIRNVP